VLFVSHSAQLVTKLCTKGIVLQDGKVVATGTAEEATRHYLQSMNLSTSSEILSGFPEPRVGMLAGHVAKILADQAPPGRVVVNIPVETRDGVCVVDVGWASEVKMKTLRTEPAWSTAPDISVQIISLSHSEEQIARNIVPLMNASAREVWVVHPNGSLVKHKQRDLDFLLKNIPDFLSLR
jgi:ABC-type multidrug transport system ATPase subunit